MSNQNVYMSVTKFVETLKEKYDVESASVYFEGKDSFINKYKNTCFKPVLIQMGNVFIKHEDIKKMLGNIVINISKKDKLNKGMYKLKISFKQLTKNEIKYYPTNLIECTNEKVIKKIKDQIVKDEDDDYKMFPDAF